MRGGGEIPGWVDIGLIPALNLVVALLVSGIVVLLIGESPVDSVRASLRKLRQILDQVNGGGVRVDLTPLRDDLRPHAWPGGCNK